MRTQGVCQRNAVWHCSRAVALRRAGVVVQVAVASTVILGFGALTIDLGTLYVAKSELQVAADSAALAGAAQLAGDEGGDPNVLARAAAQEFAQKHNVFGQPLPLDSDRDVELGKAVYNPGTGQFVFQPAADHYDAIRVTAKRTRNSRGGPILLMFANLFGFHQKDMWARATGVLIPRDIAVVIDLSASMNDDSELRHYKAFLGEEGEWRSGVEINLRDVWCALDGPAPSRPYLPGAEWETEYAGDMGPTIGVMSNWGAPVVPETYDPVADTPSGLWYLRKGANVANPTLTEVQASLQGRGYTADEISCLVSGTLDASYASQWRNRTGVTLGLATWGSGRPGGAPGGDGDAYVETAELTWAPYPSYRVGASWTWANFIDYVGRSTTEMSTTDPNLRYRFGLKTFVNFLLEDKPQINQTNLLWQTPEQPLQAVKDAVQAMTDVIVSLESLDHTSLEVFAQTAHHEVNLSEQLQAVPDRLYQRQAGHYDRLTNMGAGLKTGMDELRSPRARGASAKVIVLMSDGKPNINEAGQYVGEGAPEVNEWILRLAQEAADENMRIYTISVGRDADQNLMAQISATAGGQHFHAEGTPEQYREQLEQIFRTLGGKRPVALIE